MTKASDLESLAKTYLDLWQDQFAAIAADPANAEAMVRLFGAMASGQPLTTRPADGPLEGRDEHTGNDGAAGATGSAAPGSASGDRDDGLSQLAERIGALEKRIGQLERKLERAGGGARAKPKKRKS